MDNARLNKEISHLCSPTEGKTPTQIKKQLSNLIKTIKEYTSAQKNIFANDLLLPIRRLALYNDTFVRARALCLLRLILLDPAVPAALSALGFPFIIARSLERPNNHFSERSQAFKLLYALSPHHLSAIERPIVQALVATAKDTSDELCRLSLDIICDLSLKKTQLVASCLGLDLLINSLYVASFKEQLRKTTFVLIALMESEIGRRHFRECDFLHLIYVCNNKDRENVDLRGVKYFFKHAFNFFAGAVSLFSCDGFVAGLVDSLKSHGASPSGFFNNPLVELSDEIFRKIEKIVAEPETGKNLEFFPSFTVVLVLPLIKEGLVDVLIDMGRSATEFIRVFGQNHLKNILLYSRKFLPRQSAKYFLPLELISSKALRFSAKDHFESAQLIYNVSPLRSFGRSPVSKPLASPKDSTIAYNDIFRKLKRIAALIDNNSHYVRYRYCANLQDKLGDVELNFPNFLEPSANNKSTSINNSVLKKLWKNYCLTYSKSDVEALVKKSLVLTKNYVDWDLDACMELLKRPLWVKKHFEACRKNKFLKNLIDFFVPHKANFSVLPWNRNTVIYTKMFILFFRLMISHSEGRNMKKFQQLIVLIIDYIFENLERKYNDVGSKNSNDKINSEYITALGILSESSWGLGILKQKKVFAAFEEVIDTTHSTIEFNVRSHSTISFFIHSLDYLSQQENRRFLETIFGKCSKNLAREIICLLVSIYHLDENWLSTWVIIMLFSKVREDSIVGRDAISMIEEIIVQTDNKDILRIFGMQFLNFSMFSIHELYYVARLTETKSGVSIVKEFDLIRKGLEDWRKLHASLFYFERLNKNLIKCMRTSPDDEDVQVVPAAIKRDESLKAVRGIFSQTRKHTSENYFLSRMLLIPWVGHIQITTGAGGLASISPYCHFVLKAFVESKGAYKIISPENEVFGYIETVVGDELNYGNPFKITSDIFRIKAKLQVGADDKELMFHDEITPEQMEPLSSEKNWIESSVAIFVFDVFDKELMEEDLPSKQKTIYFTSVFFKIPWKPSKAEVRTRDPQHLMRSIIGIKGGFDFLERQGEFDRLKRSIFDPVPLSEKCDCRSERAATAFKIADILDIANVSQNPKSFQHLKRLGVYSKMSDLAYNAGSVSIKCACLAVLGVIAPFGREYISNLGWEMPIAESAPVVIPKRTKHFFEFKASQRDGPHVFSAALKRHVGLLSGEEEAVFLMISHLNSTLNVNEQIRDLKRYGKANKSIFDSKALFLAVMHLLWENSFDLYLRRFIQFDLFEHFEVDNESLRSLRCFTPFGEKS